MKKLRNSWIKMFLFDRYFLYTYFFWLFDDQKVLLWCNILEPYAFLSQNVRIAYVLK